MVSYQLLDKNKRNYRDQENVGKREIVLNQTVIFIKEYLKLE